MIKISNVIEWIKKPSSFLIALDNSETIKLPDRFYLKVLYKNKIGKKLDLNNPKTFNEKLQWLKLNDQKEIYTTMVDKNAAKKYVADIIGDQYIIPTIGVYNNFDEINIDELPKQFVMKCNHDSGTIIICKDKQSFDIEEARKRITKTLNKNYFCYSREWPYKNVKPKIIVEKYMVDNIHEDLLDYKFMCFDGVVKCSFICSDRRSKEGLAVDFYDREWNHMPFRRHYRNSNQLFSKPKNYDLMIKLAETLSKNIPFVRVDFYEIDGNVYFGELTFYPGGGFEEFEPEAYDKILGDMINLPIKKEEMNNEK